ncbi:MAG: Ribonuclease [Candidatus Parcubacteria bacterium]|jgi:ribonuclease P protein component
MLKKSERVARADFLQFFKTGRRFHSTHLTLVYVPHPTFHGSVVVSKKVSKLAVTRNKIRRRIYARLQTLRAIGGVYIVHVKPSFSTLTKHEAGLEIEALIGRMKKTA